MIDTVMVTEVLKDDEKAVKRDDRIQVQAERKQAALLGLRGAYYLKRGKPGAWTHVPPEGAQ